MKPVDYARHITSLNRDLYDELGIEQSFMAISGIADRKKVMQMVITRMKQGLWNEIMVGRLALERYATDDEKQARATAAREKIIPYMRRIVPAWRSRVEAAVASVS